MTLPTDASALHMRFLKWSDGPGGRLGPGPRLEAALDKLLDGDPWLYEIVVSSAANAVAEVERVGGEIKGRLGHIATHRPRADARREALALAAAAKPGKPAKKKRM